MHVFNRPSNVYGQRFFQPLISKFESDEVIALLDAKKMIQRFYIILWVVIKNAIFDTTIWNILQKYSFIVFFIYNNKTSLLGNYLFYLVLYSWNVCSTVSVLCIFQSLS